MPPITNTRFFILFLAILELSRLPDPLDRSRVNNKSAKVMVRISIKRISFCRRPSSIENKAHAQAEKYGITVAILDHLFSELISPLSIYSFFFPDP